MTQEKQTTQRKAKRKLSDIDFSSETSHIALVGPAVGGPASGADYALVMKSTSNFSDEFLEKASKVTVTMGIEEYLQRFFGLYSSVEADLLARSLGFTTESMDKAALEMQEKIIEDQEPPDYPEWDSEPSDSDYQRWIDSKLQSISVMKSLYEADSIPEVISKLSEEEYLNFLMDQARIEKAFKKIDIESSKKSKAVTKAKAKVTEVDTPQIVDVEKGGVTAPVVKQQDKEKSMTVETQVIEQEIEVVNKSQFDVIFKANEEMKVELQKALDLVKQFEQEKKEAIAKSRSAAINAAIKDEAKGAVIQKALKEDISEDEFQAVVKALADMQAVVEQSDLFVEKGASVEKTANINEDPVAKILKAKYNK